MPSTRFVELIVEGHPHLIRGFVAGVLHGGEGGGAIGLFFNRDHHIAEEGFGQHLAEWLGLRERLVHLVLDAAAAERVLVALEREHGLPLRLREQRTVRSASFEFHYTVYAPVYSKKVRAILDDHPASVTLEGYDPQVERHPDAKGPELYSPEHDYSEKASGLARGPLAPIVALHRACEAEELIQLKPIQLEFVEKDGSGD